MEKMSDVLADLRSFAADLPVIAQILSDTKVRISRLINGPEGWSMPLCDVATKAGDSYRYEWENGEDRFGFEGQLLESLPQFRTVTTERMIGMPGESIINETAFTPVVDATLLSILITYPNAELRDRVLSTGMTDGMEASYLRLETKVLLPA